MGNVAATSTLTTPVPPTNAADVIAAVTDADPTLLDEIDEAKLDGSLSSKMEGFVQRLWAVIHTMYPFVPEQLQQSFITAMIPVLTATVTNGGSLDGASGGGEEIYPATDSVLDNASGPQVGQHPLFGNIAAISHVEVLTIPASQVGSLLSQLQNEGWNATILNSGNFAPTSATSSVWTSDPREPQHRDQMISLGTCIVCGTEPATCMPDGMCGHAQFCEYCLHTVATRENSDERICPTCSRRFRQIVRIRGAQ